MSKWTRVAWKFSSLFLFAANEDITYVCWYTYDNIAQIQLTSCVTGILSSGIARSVWHLNYPVGQLRVDIKAVADILQFTYQICY